MSLSTYYYDPFHEPFFTAADFSRLFDAAWDARSPQGQGQQRRADNANANANSDSSSSSAVMRPRMDLRQEKNEMTATFELPGMKKEDVNIDVHNNRLVVSGQSTSATERDHDGYAVRERQFGKFSRTIPLPAGTKSEDIKATMENGVLTVKFPKSQPEQEAKRITIS